MDSALWAVHRHGRFYRAKPELVQGYLQALPCPEEEMNKDSRIVELIYSAVKSVT